MPAKKTTKKKPPAPKPRSPSRTARCTMIRNNIESIESVMMNAFACMWISDGAAGSILKNPDADQMAVLTDVVNDSIRKLKGLTDTLVELSKDP